MAHCDAKTKFIDLGKKQKRKMANFQRNAMLFIIVQIYLVSRLSDPHIYLLAHLPIYILIMVKYQKWRFLE